MQLRILSRCLNRWLNLDPVNHPILAQHPPPKASSAKSATMGFSFVPPTPLPHRSPNAPSSLSRQANRRVSKLTRRTQSIDRLLTMSTASQNPNPLSYAESGVDIKQEANSVKALLRSLGPAASRSVGSTGALVPHAAGFSGLIDFGDRLLAMCTDGVGSKMLIAEQMSYYETVALDCIAMNVNDLICVGAEPLAFVDYIAAPRPLEEVWGAIGRGLAVGCAYARVSLCGGETASLPELVTGVDMSGTALGWVPRGMQIEGTGVGKGDAILGLPASGIHSNGFSLVRKILERCDTGLGDLAPFDVAVEGRADGDVWKQKLGDVTLGEVLMNPTKIYVDPVVDLLVACREGCGPCGYEDIHGIAHITGGGLSNLLRLKKGVGFEISKPLPVLPEFEWLQKVGNVSDFEMYRTFNMGMGMCIIVAGNVANQVQAWLADRSAGAKVVGEVNDSAKVTHGIPAVVFDSY